jgi:hypothetical protein
VSLSTNLGLSFGLLFPLWLSAAQPLACPYPACPIQDWPLPEGEARLVGMQDYFRAHLDDPQADSRASQLVVGIVPQLVVLHWTAGPTSISAYNTFASARLSGRPELQGAGTVNVGAHFIVDRDGTVYRIWPEDRPIRHCIGLNHLSIGIENVGSHPDSPYPLTEAQVQANIALIRDLALRHPTIRGVIGHSEALSLRGGALYSERDPSYLAHKPDPGESFLRAVRAGLPPELSAPPR